MKLVFCPYCGKRADYINSKDYYNGRGFGMMYICRPCDATVGCHRNSNGTPLGSLASKELRALRKQCHSLFDLLWKGRNRRMDRAGAYRKLAHLMRIEVNKAHIGMFREKECLQIKLKRMLKLPSTV